MSVWEWLEWERKCLELNSGGFRFNVSFVDYTSVSINLSLRRFLVSPIYCKLQRLQGFGQIFGRTNFYLGVKRPQEKQCLCKILGWQKKRIMVCHGICDVMSFLKLAPVSSHKTISWIEGLCRLYAMKQAWWSSPFLVFFKSLKVEEGEKKGVIDV